MARKIKGLRRHGAGWQTYCRVNGEYRSQTWALDTPVSDMTAWLRTQRAQQSPTIRLHRDSFDADAKRYLDNVRALPTYAQRATHIELWRVVFAGRRRRSITSAEIRRQRETWLLQGLAPHTVNLRLRALSNLWTVLDGRRAPNPVREVPEAKEPDPEPRSLPYALALDIVHGFLMRQPLARAYARLMVTMGLTPTEIARLRPRDWNPARRALFVHGRRKGSGGASRTIPLSPDATAALREFDAARGWGLPVPRSFRRAFQRACQRVMADPSLDPAWIEQLRHATPYSLRHAYATRLYADSGDAHAAAYVLGHRDKKTTARYIEAALADRAARAVASLDASVQEERVRSAG